MSTWTLKEVRALSEKHGGGNKCCAAKYLSHGDVEKYRPHTGDSLDKFKTFVRLAYEEKMFMGEDETKEEEAVEQEEVAEEATEQAVEQAEEAEDFFDIPAAKKKSTPKKVVVEEEDFDEEEEVKPKKTVKKTVNMIASILFVHTPVKSN